MSPPPPSEASSGTLRLEGLVIRAQSGYYEVETDAGPLTAVLRGRLKKERRQEGLIALGDRVVVAFLPQPEGDSGQVEAVIDERLERETVLVRRAPGPSGVWRQHVVVANVDQLVPTFAVREPEPKLRMLDRFLALAEMDEIASVIVFNKLDLGISPELERRLAIYERIGYPVIQASSVTGEGIPALRARLTDRVSAIVGPSGVGKSSLLNAVEPGLALRVGAISDTHGKGKHTTRVGELLPLSFGGRVADTPGLREIGIWEVEPADLKWGFVEFRERNPLCRFADCSHVHEPGCAVRAAVEGGEIARERYESYLRLLEEG